MIDESGKLRLWYNCRNQDAYSNVAYTESIDGGNWTKPDFGILDYKGSTTNNRVDLHSLESAVYQRPVWHA